VGGDAQAHDPHDLPGVQAVLPVETQTHGHAAHCRTEVHGEGIADEGHLDAPPPWELMARVPFSKQVEARVHGIARHHQRYGQPEHRCFRFQNGVGHLAPLDGHAHANQQADDDAHENSGGDALDAITMGAEPAACAVWPSHDLTSCNSSTSAATLVSRGCRAGKRPAQAGKRLRKWKTNTPTSMRCRRRRGRLPRSMSWHWLSTSVSSFSCRQAANSASRIITFPSRLSARLKGSRLLEPTVAH